MPSSRTSTKASRSANTADDSVVGRAAGNRVDRPHRSSPDRFVATSTTSLDLAEVLVLDAYWIRVSWALTAQTLARAEKAFGRNWHRARPIVRVVGLSEGETEAREVEVAADVPVAGDTREWFVRCPSGTAVEAQIGYVTEGEDGRFFALAESEAVPLRSVTAPTISPDSGLSDEVMAELQRLRTGSAPFSLVLEAELVLNGQTAPGADVCIGETTVVADSDGCFSYRQSLENGRTVLPIDARSSDGKESRAGVASADFNLRILRDDDE